MLEDWEEFTLSFHMTKNIKTFFKKKKKREEITGETRGSSHAVQKTTN